MKKQKAPELPDAMEYNVSIRINVKGETIPYAPFMFPKLTNWRHCVYGTDVEKTKKTFYSWADSGSTFVDIYGNKYSLDDVTMEMQSDPKKVNPDYPCYILSMSKL